MTYRYREGNSNKGEGKWGGKTYPTSFGGNLEETTQGVGKGEKKEKRGFS